MKNWIFVLTIILPVLVYGQKPNDRLEIQVIKQTLPQLLDANPNSLASFMEGGRMYDVMMKVTDMPILSDGMQDKDQFHQDLINLSDSIKKVLKKNKIHVLLSDTLFDYSYVPNVSYYKDGYNDTIDLRNAEDWDRTSEYWAEAFQTDYEFRGLKAPVNLDFIDLIHDQITSVSTDRKIKLRKLNNSHYTFVNRHPENVSNDLKITAVRLYRPVFNENLDKACYLFSFQARNGISREFVFIEKIEGKWTYLESYGSYLIDGNRSCIE